MRLDSMLRILHDTLFPDAPCAGSNDRFGIVSSGTRFCCSVLLRRAAREILQWAGASEARWPARNVLSHAGSRLQRNDTSISKRLRKRFDNEYWHVARMLDQAPEYWRAL